MDYVNERISQLMIERQRTKNDLRHIENELLDELYQLPSDVKKAIAQDIVKPNFPVPYDVMEKLKKEVF
jgi:hypothetical protein